MVDPACTVSFPRQQGHVPCLGRRSGSPRGGAPTGANRLAGLLLQAPVRSGMAAFAPDNSSCWAGRSPLSFFLLVFKRGQAQRGPHIGCLHMLGNGETGALPRPPRKNSLVGSETERPAGADTTRRLVGGRTRIKAECVRHVLVLRFFCQMCETNGGSRGGYVSGPTGTRLRNKRERGPG